jgi:hypothetical protein
MKLRLIIADLNSNLLSVWAEAFQEISEVSSMKVDFKKLAKNSEVNAVLIRWIFAHERYGGRPVVGQSQILSTNGEVGMPYWVITTPPFSANITTESKDYDYMEWSKIFDSIGQFNKTNKESKIKTLGFELSFLYGFRSDPPYEQAKAAKKAYVDYYGKKMFRTGNELDKR